MRTFLATVLLTTAITAVIVAQPSLGLMRFTAGSDEAVCVVVPKQPVSRNDFLCVYNFQNKQYRDDDSGGQAARELVDLTKVTGWLVSRGFSESVATLASSLTSRPPVSVASATASLERAQAGIVRQAWTVDRPLASSGRFEAVAAFAAKVRAEVAAEGTRIARASTVGSAPPPPPVVQGDPLDTPLTQLMGDVRTLTELHAKTAARVESMENSLKAFGFLGGLAAKSLGVVLIGLICASGAYASTRFAGLIRHRWSRSDDQESGAAAERARWDLKAVHQELDKGLAAAGQQGDTTATASYKLSSLLTALRGREEAARKRLDLVESELRRVAPELPSDFSADSRREAALKTAVQHVVSRLKGFGEVLAPWPGIPEEQVPTGYVRLANAAKAIVGSRVPTVAAPLDVAKWLETTHSETTATLSEAQQKLGEAQLKIAASAAAASSAASILALFDGRKYGGSEQPAETAKRIQHEQQVLRKMFDGLWPATDAASLPDRVVGAVERTRKAIGLASEMGVVAGPLDATVTAVAEQLGKERAARVEDQRLLSLLNDYVLFGPAKDTATTLAMVQRETAGPQRSFRFALSAGSDLLERAMGRLPESGDQDLSELLKLSSIAGGVHSMLGGLGQLDSDSLWSRGVVTGFENGWLHDLFRAELLLQTYFDESRFVGLRDAFSMIGAGFRDVIARHGYEVVPVSLLGGIPPGADTEYMAEREFTRRPEIRTKVMACAQHDTTLVVDVRRFQVRRDGQPENHLVVVLWARGEWR